MYPISRYISINIGICQSDLVFLDTYSKNVHENGMINFQKYQKMSAIVLELKYFQREGYNMQPVPDIIHYIQTYPVLMEEQAYQYSLAAEPRI